jgi:hypothetical protein
MTFRIDWMTEQEWTDENFGGTLSGVTIHASARIGIRLLANDTVESQYQETLVHEILHAIWSVSTLATVHKHFPEDDREEEIVSIMSPPLLQVLRENPVTLKYLASER